jgi:signal transduction histidine kinase
MGSFSGINNYVAFLYTGLPEPGNNHVSDGEYLALGLLNQLKALRNEEQFPPKLLILLTSPNYLGNDSASQLLGGIRQVFERAGQAKVPLIGTSVAAVFFDRQIHENGALLICIASRLIDAQVSKGRNARDNPEAAVTDLLEDLNLNRSEVDLNPMSNRMLLTFFPDIREGLDGSIAHKSDELHGLLWKRTLCRIPIVGGTSSTPRNEENLKGIQFCNWRVYEDTLVAAQVDSGVPLGVSLCRGLERVRAGHGIVRTRVDQISEDGRFITRLDPESTQELIKEGELLLFGEDSLDRDLIVATAEPSNSGRIRIGEPIEKDATLQLLKPSPESLLRLAAEIVRRSNRRVRIKRHLGCFSLICSAHYRSPQHVAPYIKRAIANIENAFRAPCIGGFVDGEAGVDETGRSQFGNWSMAGVVLGDEMRDRTPRHRGFIALAEYGNKLTEETTLEEAIEASLRLVFETGFPGARLSFVYPDQEDFRIVCVGSLGSRFTHLNAGSLETDHLETILDSARPLFLKEIESQTVSHEPVHVGKYVIPIVEIHGDVIAVLEVDLGSVGSDQNELQAVEQEVLRSLGAAIGGGLNNIFNLQVANRARSLDEALAASLSAQTVRKGLATFIEAAVKGFGADMGHIRLARHEEGYLELVAGYGDYYKVAKRHRTTVRFDDGSPTCEAYYSGRITIVNDAVRNAAHKRTVTNNKEPLKTALESIGSCANAVFKDTSGESLGTINIVSTKPWFFTLPYKRSLKSLANRTGLLVKHLAKKEDEAQAHKRIEFLLSASPQLARVDFADMPAALDHAVSRFCAAARADYGSLYLLDKDVGKYVLRAQLGWVEPKWINIARYEIEGGWLWNAVQQADPQYYPELVADKQLYAEQMFGGALRPHCQISAIGLPLTLGSVRLGMLALYRKKCSGKNGFATTAGKDLVDAADPIAALVGIILSRKEADFRERMQTHFKKVSDLFIPEHGREVVEDNLCKYAVEIFGATTANLFWDTRVRGQQMMWVAGYSTLTISGESPPVEPDSVILSIQNSGDPVGVRNQIPIAQHDDFDSASTDGLIIRQCIPIFINKRVLGVLDLTWDSAGRTPMWEPSHYRKNQLRILGTVIGSAHNRYALTADKVTARRARELAKREARAMSLMHDQSAHITGNLLIKLQALPDFIKTKQTAAEREKLAEEVHHIFAHGKVMIEKILEWARGTMSSNPEPHRLLPMLNGIIEKVESQLTGSEHDPEIAIQVEVFPESLSVYVNDNPVEQAFFNIINNGIEAIRKRSSIESFVRRVTIAARANDQESEVEILFQDSGIGMSQELIAAAKQGFLNVPGNKGFGVLSSIIFIGVQGGTFDIFSDGKTGTTVRVTLPCVEKE